MRVLQVTNKFYPDSVGGLERYVTELSVSLANSGHYVDLLGRQCSDRELDLEIERIQLHRYPSPSPRNPLFILTYLFATWRSMRRLMRGLSRPDVVHCHYPAQALVLVMMRRSFVYTFHAPAHKELISEHQNRYLLPEIARNRAVAVARFLEGIVLRRAMVVVTLSDFMKREAEAIFSGVGQKHRLVPGGVDLRRFHGETPRSRHDHLRGPVVFAARRMVPRTGVLELIRAFAAVVRSHPHAQLRLAGGGPLEVEARALARSLGLESSVEFLGLVSDEQLVREYSLCDLAITPTQELEGFGLSTAEAMACGTPVVVTPAGANPELVRDLAPEHLAVGIDSQAIGEAICQTWEAIESGTIPAGGAFYADIAQQWSWGTVVGKHLEIYRASLAETRFL